MQRADAQRNVDALLTAAKAEFLESGVDVNVRAIAARAGVGTATLYRHFPQRSDLIGAVFRKEIDELVTAGSSLAESYEPDEALERWIHRYINFVATKHGFAATLHSDDPTVSRFRTEFERQVGPVVQSLLDAAETAGLIGGGVAPLDLLGAIANLCVPPPGSTDTTRAYRMVELLLAGMRSEAAVPPR
jgi:AcrR family transcriptional regulator